MNAFISAFGIDWHLLLIQAINFGLLLAALTYFLYQPIISIIDKRRKEIEDSVVKASQADKSLADAKREGDRMVGDAAREAERLAAEARTQAQVRRDEIVKDAEARADATMKDAAARAEEAKRLALKESEREIARAAVLAAEKILHEKSA